MILCRCLSSRQKLTIPEEFSPVHAFEVEPVSMFRQMRSREHHAQSLRPAVAGVHVLKGLSVYERSAECLVAV